MPFGSIDLLCEIQEKEKLSETLTSHFKTKEAIESFMIVHTIPHRKIHTYEHLIRHCLDYLHQRERTENVVTH